MIATRIKTNNKSIDITNIDKAIDEYIKDKTPKNNKASFTKPDVIHIIKEMYKKSCSSVDMAKFLNERYNTKLYKPNCIRNTICEIKARGEL